MKQLERLKLTEVPINMTIPVIRINELIDYCNELERRLAEVEKNQDKEITKQLVDRTPNYWTCPNCLMQVSSHHNHQCPNYFKEKVIC